MNRQIFNLAGHMAKVTGGNGGLGLAMAKGLVKSGAKIAIWGRNAFGWVVHFRNARLGLQPIDYKPAFVKIL